MTKQVFFISICYKSVCYSKQKQSFDCSLETQALLVSVGELDLS